MKPVRYNTGATMMVGVFLCILGLGFWVGNYYPEFNLFKFLNLAQNWPFFLVMTGFLLIVQQYNDWWKNNDEN